jgi:hypothetical protein
MTDYSPEEIEKMRAQVAAADMARAEEARQKRLAYLTPVTELVNSPEWTVVLNKLTDMTKMYENDQFFSVHVTALAQIMPRLVETIGTTGHIIEAGPVVQTYVEPLAIPAEQK